MRPPSSENIRVRRLVCVGLDATDGHKRVTQTNHFLLVGGSAETHQRMQDTAMLFEEYLDRRGMQLDETDFEEVLELLCEARTEVAEASER
jgi:hypothetical protein